MRNSGPSISDRVRAAMALKRVTGVDLAKYIGRDPSYVSRRTTGEVEWSATDLLAVADRLDVPVEHFFQDVPVPRRSEGPDHAIGHSTVPSEGHLP